MKILASPQNNGIFVPQITGSSIGEGSMKTVNTGTVVPLEKCPFRAFPSRPALYAGRLLTIKSIVFDKASMMSITCDAYSPVRKGHSGMFSGRKLCMMLLSFAFLSLTHMPGQVRASDVSIVATVDKSEATLEDYILLKIAVEGTREEPALPDMFSFKVQSRGTSSQVRIENGRMSSSMEYNYLLYPQKTGSFVIGPFTVNNQGETIKSNIITVNIRKSLPQSDQSRDIFVTAEVDNDKPYLYEEIIYRFKFYRRVKVANAQLTDNPPFDGFIAENMGKEKEYQQVINGQTYMVTEIKQALFPIKTGVLEILPSTLNCDVVVQQRRQRRDFFGDPFFGRNETAPKSLRTSAITVMVKPLPSEGRPSGYNNLVGDFKLTASVSKNKLKVGESLTLTLALKGAGNLNNIQTIDIGELQNFKVYDDKPVFEPLISGGKLGGNLVVKKALVPLTEGKLKIPPIRVSFFNPSTGTYKTEEAGPYILEVLPSTEKEKFEVVEASKTTDTKEEVKILGHDIQPVHTSLDSLYQKKLKPISFLSVLCLLFPVAGFISCLLLKRHKESNTKDNGLGRAKTAYKSFKKKLPVIKNTMTKDEILFYETASKAVKDFIGDKLNISGSALTSNELGERLSASAISEDTVRELTKISDLFESGNFGFKKYSFDERQAAFNSMIKLIKILDKKLKR
jgi:hypothetical protein